MNRRMTGEATGLGYMVQHNLQDIQNGVILFDPSQHSQLWAYVTIDGNTFTNQPDLVYWDLNITEWGEHSMGVWPFGIYITDKVEELRGVLASLEELDSFLEDELFIMDQEEAADEGYDNDPEDDHINFGLTPMLMHILKYLV